MPSFLSLLSIASTLSELKWAITSPKKGQAMQRDHEEQSAHSKGACLSPLDLSLPRKQEVGVKKLGAVKVKLERNAENFGREFLWGA